MSSTSTPCGARCSLRSRRSTISQSRWKISQKTLNNALVLGRQGILEAEVSVESRVEQHDRLAREQAESRRNREQLARRRRPDLLPPMRPATQRRYVAKGRCQSSRDKGPPPRRGLRAASHASLKDGCRTLTCGYGLQSTDWTPRSDLWMRASGAAAAPLSSPWASALPLGSGCHRINQQADIGGRHRGRVEG